MLWYNSRIRIAGKPVFWKNNLKGGLEYVYQLFGEDGFKSEEQVFLQFGLSKMRFNSLKVAIPKEWKDFFVEHVKEQYFPLPPSNYDRCIISSNFSREVYKTISTDVSFIHSKFVKWQQDLGYDICEDIFTFGKMHLNVYQVTNIAKFRSFQYRLLQRGIVTNIQLYKWKLKNNEYCSFCQNERETVLHLFVQCPIVKELWQSVMDNLSIRYQVEMICINPENVILNRIVVQKKNHILNFVCLLLKQFIYRQRCLNEPIHSAIFMRYLSKIEGIEKYIAVKNSRLATHLKKWGGRKNSAASIELENFVIDYNQNIF